MKIIYAVHEQHIEDDAEIAIFCNEIDANKCADYLNNFKRSYTHYYVEESYLYDSFQDYLEDVKSP